ncbi:MAG: hypothetical protein ACFFBP_15220 [Promethearchaeota archaeon]
MLEQLKHESKQTEKIALKMVNKAYPDTESLYLIKKKLEIIDQNGIIKKKRKFTLNSPCLTIRNGVLTHTDMKKDINLDLVSSKKVKVEVHDKKNNEIRIHKFKVILE